MADTISILNGLDHEQDQTTSIIYDIDHAVTECVSVRPVTIPRGKSANIVFNNTYDADGSTIFVMVRMVRMTSVDTPTYTESEVLAWQEIA